MLIDFLVTKLIPLHYYITISYGNIIRPEIVQLNLFSINCSLQGRVSVEHAFNSFFYFRVLLLLVKSLFQYSVRLSQVVLHQFSFSINKGGLAMPPLRLVVVSLTLSLTFMGRQVVELPILARSSGFLLDICQIIQWFFYDHVVIFKDSMQPLPPVYIIAS